MHIQLMQFPFITYGMVLYKRQYNRQTQTLSKCMCMRASGASELRKFWPFYILKLLFLSIFCRYTSNTLIGTNDMLVGLQVPTNVQMYRQSYSNVPTKLCKSIIGGGGPCPPPPPSGYANAQP